MPRKGRRQRSKKQDLTLFGRWVETLSTVLGTNQTKLGQATGLSQSTISKAVRDGTTIDTVSRLWQEFDRLAKQQGFADLLTVAYEESFFVSAWRATERQLVDSEQRLRSLQVVIHLQETIKMRDEETLQLGEVISELRSELVDCDQQIRGQDQLIAQLRAEIEILKRQIPPEERERLRVSWSER